MASTNREPIGASPTNVDQVPRPQVLEHHFTTHPHGTHGHEASDDSSASSSSYDSSDSGRPVVPSITSCHWRTPRFHNQECSRFFDCPSHQIERQLSDDQDESDQDEDGPETTTHPINAVSRAGERFGGESVWDNGERTSGAGKSQTPSPVPGSNSALRDPPTWARSTSHGQITAPPQSSSPLTSVPLSGEPPAPLPALALRPAPQSRATATRPSIQPLPPPQAHIARHLPDITLPRWQPDAEVTYCPICHTQFSIFVRKHHCRKCGRVVCNSCSPHRITIPYQYIVRNPAVVPPRQSTSPPADSDSQDLGGERVRLCNPCVPDPNTTPPQPQASPSQFSPRAHGRSHSTLINAYLNNPPPNHHGRPAFGSSSNDAHPRTRSSTIQSSLHPAPSSSRQPQPPQRHMDQRAASGGMTIHHQTTAPLFTQRTAGTTDIYRNILGFGSPSATSSLRASSNSASSSSHRALPPEPPQLAEEDECPVCHRELPSMRLPNPEALREQHVTSCIAAYSAYSGGPVQGSPDGRSAFTTRRSGIFPYVATEKDCVDSAECTICLEEFEVGVAMARLECLCRFHKGCIMAWFVGHPGRCPVHQYGDFGF